MLTRDRVVAAMARLDPASRALLELSTRRGLSEEEIGDLLAMEPAEIRRRRQESVGRLGAELGVGATHYYELQEELTRLGDAEWRGEGPPRTSAREDRPRHRSTLVAIGVLLSIAAAVAVLVLGSGDGERDESSGPAGNDVSRARGKNATKPKKRTPPGTVAVGPVIPMERLNDTRGRGSAQIRREGDRAELRLRVTGFPPPRGGGYAVWLFNSREDARRLYATERTSIERDIPLPANVGRYRFVEVARAVPRLNSRHSGLTLLRAPIRELAETQR